MAKYLLLLLLIGCSMPTSRYPYTITTVDGEHTFIITCPDDEPKPITGLK